MEDVVDAGVIVIADAMEAGAEVVIVLNSFLVIQFAASSFANSA